MVERVLTDSNGRKYITTEPYKPNWDEKAVLVEEMQRMAKRIEELALEYERGFVAGAQHQMQSSVDRAVNRMALLSREWVGLTDKDIDALLDLAYANDFELVRHIESKIKEINHE
jgi:hypothetical protein